MTALSKQLMAAAMLAMAGAMLAPVAMAQSSYQPPRQHTGKPDLQGVWSTASVTRLERPPGLPLVLTPGAGGRA